MNEKSHRWQRTVIAASVAALLGLWGGNALALSLGRVSVQSALGEPLRAEVDVPEINAEEVGSLKASVASPDAFRAAGMEYNAALPGVRITLQKRADGRSFLRLVSDRVVSEPFVDLILEATWATGRVVRDYTMLFDPPGLRAPAATAPSVAQIPAAAANATTTPSGSAAPRNAAPRVATPAVVSKPQPAATAPKAEKVSPATPSSDAARSITVKSGDTASKIAASTKPAAVSLDQMLVALLRANPDAFIDENINRLKAGAIVNVPSSDQIQSTSPEAASQIVRAQSKDFNEFRRKLASNAPAAQVETANRQVTGSVQAKVEETKPAPATPDKLTLSKGASSAEAKLAQERSQKEAVDRASELSKNINELTKMAAASSAAAAGTPTMAAPASAPVIQTPVAAVVSLPAAEPASAPAMAVSSSGPAAAAVSAPPPVAKVPVPVPAPTPVEEPGIIDQLLENPLIPAGGAALIALLAGFGIYRARQRKNMAQVDSSYLESRLQPDSFFGASGGQRVDTKDGGLTASSMVYSPSQLEAADDVDPVAEADVYLAYGRDLQAEEILKEALRANSGRVAIHQKLAEIYAKRQDVKNFEEVAAQAHKLTEGDGPVWERICELGLSIDPTNDLYQPGGEPSTSGASLSRPSSLDKASSFAASTVTLPVEVNEPLNSRPVDLDLDLDFSANDVPSSSLFETRQSSSGSVPSGAASAAAIAGTAAAGMSKLMQNDRPESEDSQAMRLELPDLELSTKSEDTDLENVALAKQAQHSFGSTEPATLSNSSSSKDYSLSEPGMLEFDLGSLSLELEDSTEGSSTVSQDISTASQDISTAHQDIEAEDPLATKLALAEEFVAIGDNDGARALIEEVISEASGAVKARAEMALKELA